MKVSDILRVKGSTLYTAAPDEPLSVAVNIMSEKDIGSLVVIEYGDLVGMLTFREVIQAIVKNGGSVGTTLVRSAMDDHPLTLHIGNRSGRSAPHDAGAPCALHARDRQSRDDGRDQLLRRRTRRGGQPEFREHDAQGLHPRLAQRFGFCELIKNCPELRGNFHWREGSEISLIP